MPSAAGRDLTTGAAATQVVKAARAIADRGLVVGSLGNVSLRVGDRILITPTRIRYADMAVEDVVPLDLQGRRCGGRHEPSREAPLHVRLHAEASGDSAVVHTHGVHSTAWSFLGIALPVLTEDLGYYDIGAVRVAPYARPGSPALVDGAAAALHGSRAVLLARHGAVAVGTSLDEAVTIAEVVERQAQLALMVRRLGPLEPPGDAG
jgi:L-fuculose-phosphate aldolase